MQLEFSHQISKNSQVQNFIEIRLVGAKLLHAERWTDMTKLTTVAVRNFAEAS